VSRRPRAAGFQARRWLDGGGWPDHEREPVDGDAATGGQRQAVKGVLDHHPATFGGPPHQRADLPGAGRERLS